MTSLGNLATGSHCFPRCLALQYGLQS